MNIPNVITLKLPSHLVDTKTGEILITYPPLTAFTYIAIDKENREMLTSYGTNYYARVIRWPKLGQLFDGKIVD